MIDATRAGKTSIDVSWPADSVFLKKSEFTQKFTTRTLKRSVNALNQLGFNVRDFSSVKPKHLARLVYEWLYTYLFSPVTVANYLMYWRHYAQAFHRQALEDCIETLLKQVRTLPKPTENLQTPVIDAQTLAKHILAIDKIDEIFGRLLRMQLVFNLTSEEAIKCYVHIQDFGTHLHTLPGQSRNKKPRVISEITGLKRTILDAIKDKVPKTTPLGWPHPRLDYRKDWAKYAIRVFDRASKWFKTHTQLSIDIRTLRTYLAKHPDYLEAFMCALCEQLPTQATNTAQRSVTVEAVPMTLLSEKTISTIQEALLLIKMPPSIPNLYRTDCLFIQRTLQNAFIDARLSQVFVLWQAWCQLQGATWLKSNNLSEKSLLIAAQILIQKMRFHDNAEIFYPCI
jgi:hypothetical protein